MKIPVKKYVMDESLPWEQRYARLLAHHEEETTFLIAYARKLERFVMDLRDRGLYDDCQQLQDIIESDDSYDAAARTSEHLSSWIRRMASEVLDS